MAPAGEVFVLAELSKPNPEGAAKSSASETSDTERTPNMGVPSFVQSSLNAEAPDFIPMSFNAEAPAFVPMPSLPPGLEDYMPYSSSYGYPSLGQDESESDSGSNDDIKIDGNTPIAEILALSFLPRQRSSAGKVPAVKFSSVSTAGSLGDLGDFQEDVQH